MLLEGPGSPRFRAPIATRRIKRTTMTILTEAAPETCSFEADVARLLHLMVHSVYSDKEIFLRVGDHFF